MAPCDVSVVLVVKEKYKMRIEGKEKRKEKMKGNIEMPR